MPNQPVRHFLHASAVAAASTTTRFRSLSLGTPAHQVARQRRNLGSAAEPLQSDFSPYGYMVIGGPLESIFATIGEFTDLGVPEATLLKDDLSWRHWVRYCRLAGTSPWRMDRNAHSGADAAGFDRESRLLYAFLIWCYDDIQPRPKAGPAPKPESAYAMVCGVRRIHRRQNVSMVSCTQLCAVLKGLTKAFILEHGAEALLPAASPWAPTFFGACCARTRAPSSASHGLTGTRPFSSVSAACSPSVAGRVFANRRSHCRRRRRLTTGA